MVPQHFRSSSRLRLALPCYKNAWLTVALSIAILAQGASAATQSRAGSADRNSGKPPSGPSTPFAPASKAPSAEEVLQRHYDAARTYQLGGDNQQSAREYNAFLAGALRACARAYASTRDYDRATSLFEDALSLVPGDAETRLAYAEMYVQQEKWGDAAQQTDQVLKLDPGNSSAHALLGRILYTQDKFKEAREHLEAAASVTPTFDTGYFLGITYLKLEDLPRARLVFDDMVRGFGDTARLHIVLGLAYRQVRLYDQAAQELAKAIAKDPKLGEAHYFLALAYLGRDSDAGFPAALPELETAVRLNPDDARSHYLLGYIAMKQHDYKRAEAELLRNAALDPRNPDAYVLLGQIYSESGRDADAEKAILKAISLTEDPSRNNYQIRGSHYVLGRILLRTGRAAEAEKQMRIAKDLADRSNQARTADSAANGKLSDLAELSKKDDMALPSAAPAAETTPEERKKVEAFVDQLKPAIADAYNNLGVIMAGEKDFEAALRFFRKTGQWSPTLQTLDRNWGMAAFYANEYQQAIDPLDRHLSSHPDDARARAALGLSLFMQQDFRNTRATLAPIQSEVDGDPGLSYAYAVSMLKTGEYNEGIRRLKALDQGGGNSAEIHMLLGEAYADQQEYDNALQEYRKSLAIEPNHGQTHYLAGLALIRQGKPKEAVDELRAALKLEPGEVPAKYHLAFALAQTQQKQEAQSLLQQVIQQDASYADAYYELSKLQLDAGDTKGAIANLETGIKAKPDAEYMHYQLAMAYRREARTEDADREIKLYQALKNRQRGRDVSQTN